MNTQEFYSVFNSDEQQVIAQYTGAYGSGSTDFVVIWENYVRLAPGGIITHDGFSAVVDFMNINGGLQSGRYATIMAQQPSDTSAPDIRSL